MPSLPLRFGRSLPTFAMLLLPFVNLVAQAQKPDSAATVQSIWQKENTPDNGVVLLSLSADSPSDIWSVGNFGSLQFNGSMWSSFPAAAFQTQQPSEDTLNGVAALSATDAWAVGTAVVETVSGGSHLVSLIEHFDGTQWSIVPSPQFASGSELNAIQALSATDIFAVGDAHSDSQKPTPLMEHFDGSNWSVVSLPQLGRTGTLRGIAALSDSDIWVVGDSGTVVPTKTVAMHFDGRGWTIVPLPVPLSGKVHDLRLGEGLTAIASNDVWAVGNFAPASSVAERTLTEHWDGHSWKIVPSPNMGHTGSSNVLRGLSAVSSTSVWACGQTEDNSVPIIENLIEHWDGTRWTISPVSPGHGFAALIAMFAFPDGSVYAAGADVDGGGFLTSVIFHTDQGN